ncbi:MAG: hypothetical protein DRI90_09535 [Deltaproteobacteria bacterium]|nr:MAG: hypothetical protein DRI90_09535 [Deltaproteobacteria bacterium]
MLLPMNFLYSSNWPLCLPVLLLVAACGNDESAGPDPENGGSGGSGGSGGIAAGGSGAGGAGAGGGSASGVQTITGAGFGSGPTVVLFDSFSTGSDGDPVALDGPEIGAWASSHNHAYGFDGTLPTLRAYHNRNWMAARDVANLASTSAEGRGLRHVAAQTYTEFRISFRVVCPDGFLFPGTTGPNQTDFKASNWKMTWFGLSTEGNAADSGSYGGPDVVIPTIVQSWHSPAGNGLSVSYFDDDVEGDRPSFASMSGTHESLYSYYQKDESSLGAKDGVLQWWIASGGTISRQRKVQSQPMQASNWPIANKHFDMFIAPGWMGNTTANGGAGFPNVLPLYADVYLAVGPSSSAMIVVSDAGTLAASTKAYIIPPSTWTDTEITFVPRPWEDLSHRHLVLADGTLREDV